MKSRLNIDELIEFYLDENLRNDGCIPDGSYWNAQDTEDNNETEVYVYVPVGNRGDIPYVISKCNDTLGLTDDYRPWTEEPDSGHPDHIRLEFVVTICHRVSNNMEAFV